MRLSPPLLFACALATASPLLARPVAAQGAGETSSPALELRVASELERVAEESLADALRRVTELNVVAERGAAESPPPVRPRISVEVTVPRAGPAMVMIHGAGEEQSFFIPRPHGPAGERSAWIVWGVADALRQVVPESPLTQAEATLPTTAPTAEERTELEQELAPADHALQQGGQLRLLAWNGDLAEPTYARVLIRTWDAPGRHDTASRPRRHVAELLRWDGSAESADGLGPPR